MKLFTNGNESVIMPVPLTCHTPTADTKKERTKAVQENPFSILTEIFPIFRSLSRRIVYRYVILRIPLKFLQIRLQPSVLDLWNLL